ncbi:hypothetical protein [Nibribacter koreensis]|uniref:Uncharacterized protein n=1 Tax=Nibribacter koreensis TaxID=1084519 RepID=A0ABP8F6B5_9BACT
MVIDFNQARSKHTFFRTRVRGFLLGSEADPDTFKAYLRELGAWVEALATRYHLEEDEVLEANYLHSEMTAKTEALIKCWDAGRETEARERFQEMETTGKEFLTILSRLEQKTKKI